MKVMNTKLVMGCRQLASQIYKYSQVLPKNKHKENFTKIKTTSNFQVKSL